MAFQGATLLADEQKEYRPRLQLLLIYEEFGPSLIA